MKILLVSQYFWPENFIINDLVKMIVRNGHEVVVLTGKPNYPDGLIYPGYQQKGVQRELFDGTIEVLRVPLRSRGKNRAVDLFLNYLSFVTSGLLCFPKLLKGMQFDVVLVFAPSPITTVIPAILIKYLKNAHLAVWIQDLWPESLSATGFIKNTFLLKLVGWMVKGIYKCSDTLLIQSKSFLEPVARYTKKNKIVYYPNSLDSSLLNPARDESLLSSELIHILQENFCVVFAGNIGTAQSIETLVDAAVLLKNIPDFKLVFVGSGSKLGWLHEQIEEKQINNIFLAGRFPLKDMPVIYRLATCLVASLKNEKIFSYTIPSKVQAYLAAGKPIVAAMNGEGARIVAEAEAGFCCEAENAEELARCIRRLYSMPEADRRKMGMAGKAFFQRYFDMDQQAKRLTEILETRITKSGGALNEDIDLGCERNARSGRI